MLRHRPELVAEVFHHLAERLDGLVPLAVGQAGFHAIEMSGHLALGPIDLNKLILFPYRSMTFNPTIIFPMVA